VNFSSVIHSIFGLFSVDALSTSFLGEIMNGLALQFVQVTEMASILGA